MIKLKMVKISYLSREKKNYLIISEKKWKIFPIFSEYWIKFLGFCPRET